MVSYKIILDQRRPKTNGEYPIVIRIFYKRKFKVFYSGVSIFSEYWNEALGQIIPSHTNYKILNKTILQKFLKIQTAVAELEATGDFSFEVLKEKLDPNVVPKISITVERFTTQLIEDMVSVKRIGNSIVYKTALNRIIRYSNSDLTFKQLDYNFLEGFKKHLITEGVKTNSVSHYFRTIKAIYNKAIKAKVVDRSLYPFHDISIKTERTVKRAITVNEMKTLAKLQFEPGCTMWEAHSYFLLSFALIGTSFTDLAYLTVKSIVKDRLVFRRRKTGKLYNIRITTEADKLLQSLKNPGAKFLLPILPHHVEEDTLEAKKLILQWIKTTNKYLERISDQMELDTPLTTYVARHTWATTAKRMGYSNELIAEAMGHEYGNRTTAIYLDSFDQEVIDEMNEKVCKMMELV